MCNLTIDENFDANNDDNPAFIITDNELILNDPEDIDYETQSTITLRFNGSLSSGESDEKYSNRILSRSIRR